MLSSFYYSKEFLNIFILGTLNLTFNKSFSVF